MLILFEETFETENNITTWEWFYYKISELLLIDNYYFKIFNVVVVVVLVNSNTLDEYFVTFFSVIDYWLLIDEVRIQKKNKQLSLKDENKTWLMIIRGTVVFECTREWFTTNKRYLELWILLMWPGMTWLVVVVVVFDVMRCFTLLCWWFVAKWLVVG